jgi:hypothetical protein
MVKGMIAAAAVGALVLGVFAPPAHANYWGAHRELLTFSAPIALPGVVLAAGTYLFEIPSEGASHTLVRVSSRDGRHIYVTQFTLEVRAPAHAPKVTFREAARGSAAPIDTWYPLGDEMGRRFVY